MRRRATLRQPAAWLLATSGLILYVWAPTTVPADHAARVAAVSAWLPVAAPVLLYGLLLAGLPGVPLFRRIAGAAVLCAGHVGLGLVTTAVYAATALVPPDRAGGEGVWTYPAAAVIQLLAVPLVAFPLRDLLLPAPRGPRGRRDALGRAPTPAPTRVWDEEPVPFAGGVRDDTPSRITPTRRRPPPEEPRPTPTPTRPLSLGEARREVARLATPPAVAAPPPPAPPVTEPARRGRFEVPPSPPAAVAPAAPAPPGTPAPREPVRAAAPAVVLDEALTELAARPEALADVRRGRETAPARAPAPVVAPVAVQPVAPAPTEPPIRTERRLPAGPVEPAAPPEPPAPAVRASAVAPPVEPVASPERPITLVRAPAPAPPPAPEASRASVAVIPAPSQAPVADAIPRTEHVIEAQRVAALLRPVGRLAASVQTLMGITLLGVCSPRLAREAVVGTAFRVLSLLADSPHPVTQATLRGPAGAIVLTPLGSLAAGGPVIVAATPARGSLALLELLSRRAAATHPGLRGAGAGPAAPAGAVPAAGHLREVPVPPRLEQLARSVGGWGALTPRAFHDPPGRLLLYLLLAPGADALDVGRLARDLSPVMAVEDHPGGIGPVQSLDLRLGDQRLVVRPVAGAPDQSTVLVAAGAGADRPGLAQREVERVVGRLVAAS